MLAGFIVLIERLTGLGHPPIASNVSPLERREYPRFSVDSEISGKIIDSRGNPFAATVLDASRKGY